MDMQHDQSRSVVSGLGHGCPETSFTRPRALIDRSHSQDVTSRRVAWHELDQAISPTFVSVSFSLYRLGKEIIFTESKL